MHSEYPQYSSVCFIDGFIETPVHHCVNDLVERLQINATYHAPHHFGLSSLEKITKPKAIIILGSASHVGEESWHEELIKFLKQFWDQVPVLGICFGHQLLAHAFGSTISWVDEEKAKYTGLRTVDFNGKTMELAYSHAQYVSELDSELEEMGKTKDTANDIFKHKTLPIWGIQAHPEASEEFLLNDCSVMKEDLARVRLNGLTFIDKFLKEQL